MPLIIIVDAVITQTTWYVINWINLLPWDLEMFRAAWQLPYCVIFSQGK